MTEFSLCKTIALPGQTLAANPRLGRAAERCDSRVSQLGEMLHREFHTGAMVVAGVDQATALQVAGYENARKVRRLQFGDKLVCVCRVRWAKNQPFGVVTPYFLDEERLPRGVFSDVRDENGTVDSL